MSNEDLTRPRPTADGLHAVEQALAAFAPRPAIVDRDRLMFEAGAASERAPVPASASRRWAWPSATAALAATSLALTAMLWIRPEQKVQIVYLDREATVPAPPVAPAHVPQDPEVPTHRAIVSDEPLRIAIDPSVARAAETRRPNPPAHNYLQTREVALRMGLDAIGSPRRVGDGAVSPTYFDWLSSLAEAPAEAQPSAAGLPSKM